MTDHKNKHVVSAKSTKKGRRGRTDQRAHATIALFITMVYCMGMYYGLSTYGFENIKGLHFHSDVEWMNVLVSPFAVYVTPLLYFLAVMIVSRMSTRFPAMPWIKSHVQPVYNIVQIVVCSYMVWGMLPLVDVKNGNPFGLNSKRSKTIEWFVFVHYLTKFLDWTDTFIMIFNKSYRQLSFLQVFHHATIGMIWGAVLSCGWGSGTAFYGAFINSVTHVLMYTHYFWTSMGFKNPFKRYLTKFQLAQFASCVLHAILVAFSGLETVFPSNGLPMIQIMYHPIMLYLFGVRMSWSPTWLSGVNLDDVAVKTASTSTKKKKKLLKWA